MMTEQQKRMLKLMGLNEQSTFGTPSFDNLKIEKDIQEFLGFENLEDFFSDEKNELLIEQLKKLFESETNEELIQTLENSNPTKITSILARIKNDLAMIDVYEFLKEVKRRMSQQYLK